jgi:hypothetical protein
MALTHWCQTCLQHLETSVLNHEFRRLKSLTPDEKPMTLLALAFRALSGDGCSLGLINRLESRYDRQYHHTLDRLEAIQDRRMQFDKKVNMSERTQQVAEKPTRLTVSYPVSSVFISGEKALGHS